MLVIGVGLSRTGTNSLKLALEHLTGEPCYHMFELLGKHRSHTALWLKLFQLVFDQPDGEVKEDAAEKLLEEIFNGYQCCVEYPSCVFYKQLMQLYPNAKVCQKYT